MAGRTTGSKAQSHHPRWIVKEWCRGEHRGLEQQCRGFHSSRVFSLCSNPHLLFLISSPTSLPAPSLSHLSLLAGIWTHPSVLASGTLFFLFPWPSCLALQWLHIFWPCPFLYFSSFVTSSRIIHVVSLVYRLVFPSTSTSMRAVISVCFIFFLVL